LFPSLVTYLRTVIGDSSNNKINADKERMKYPLATSKLENEDGTQGDNAEVGQYYCCWIS
jgi:hypothetical protein